MVKPKLIGVGGRERGSFFFLQCEERCCWAIDIGKCDPKKCYGDGDEAGPDPDDGGRPAAPSHEPLGERVEMGEHPEAKEDSPEELAPRGVGAIDGACRGHRHAHQVHHHDDEGRDHERGPLDLVKLRKRVRVVVTVTRR